MQFYEITHIIDNEEWEAKLSNLAERAKELNGMGEQELLQFAVQTMPMYKVWLMYLEDFVIDLEQSKKRKSFFEKLLKTKKGD